MRVLIKMSPYRMTTQHVAREAEGDNFPNCPLLTIGCHLARRGFLCAFYFLILFFYFFLLDCQQLRSEYSTIDRNKTYLIQCSRPLLSNLEIPSTEYQTNTLWNHFRKISGPSGNPTSTCSRMKTRLYLMRICHICLCILL